MLEQGIKLFGEDEPQEEPKASPPERDEKSAALEQEVKELREQLAEMRRLLMLTREDKPASQPQDDEIDIPDDALYDKKALREAVEKLVEKRIAAQKEEQVSQSEAQQRITALWNDFAQAYPDYATQPPSRVRFAVAEVVAQMQQRGEDVWKTLQVAPDAFFKKVVKVYDDTFGTPGEKRTQGLGGMGRAAPKTQQAPRRQDGGEEQVDPVVEFQRKFGWHA